MKKIGNLSYLEIIILFVNNMKRYGRRYPLRRSRRPRRSRRYAGKKATTKLVKQIIHRSVENKQSYNVDQLEITPKMQSINCFRVIPPLEQGVKEGQRVGNRVKVRSLKLGLSLTMVTDPYAPSDTGKTGVYFDIYVFKCIQKPSYDQPVLNSDLDFFLQAGNASNAYTGQAFNWHQNINQDRFNILYRKRVLMNNIYSEAGSPSLAYAAYGQNTNSARSLTIPLSKKILKNLKFADQATNPTNDAIYCCVVGCRADNIWAPDVTFPIGQVYYFSNMVYEDA